MRNVFAALGLSVLAVGTFLACNSVIGIDSAQSVTFAAIDDCKSYCTNMNNLSCPPGPNGLEPAPNEEYLTSNSTATDPCWQMCNFRINQTDEQTGGAVDTSSSSNATANNTDSFNCRVWHANAALNDPQLHCPHAGALGGGVCDKPQTPCDIFCAMAMNFCKGSEAAYGSQQECVNACTPDAGPDGAAYKGFPYIIGPDASDLAASGNTLNCRLYHLENFIKTQQAVHCTHISKGGGGMCVDTPN
jgi:hypothetical protein